MADKLTLDRHDMKNRETAHLRIYVGGIPDNTTIDDLYNHFIEYGQINGVLVNRNFGFVQFETEESAQQAIAKGHGTQFLEKRLIVKTAQTTDKSRTENNTSFTETPAPAAPVDNADLYDNSGNYIGDQSYEEEEEYSKPWGGGMRGAARGRGMRMRGRGRGAPPGFRDRSPLGGRGGDWSERGPSYDRFPKSDFPRVIPVSEKNDCEIIVVSKSLTEYAEYIETRLKRLGIVVDLLYPMEDVPIGKVLGNIASRGCLYAILVMPLNQEHRSLTLTILHGLPQEHRNMPLEDALQLISRNYQEVQRGGSGGREAVYALLGQLADGRSLTVLQYDKILDYLKERREQQVKLELGEPTPPTSKQQVDLQQRILSILNDKKVPEPEPAPTQSKLLNDPTVRKALDSILQKFT